MSKEELSAKIFTLLEQKKLKEKLEKDLAVVTQELEEKVTQLNDLTKHLEKEKQDVENLENQGLTSLFYTILGNYEQKLEKERQEFLAIQLTHATLQHQVQRLTQEQTTYLQQLAPLANVESDYETILLKKEQALLDLDNPVTAKLFKLLETIAAVYQELQEIDEALKIGQAVLVDLEQLGQSLNSALSRDRFLHQMEAKVKIYDIQDKMALFNRELADIKGKINIKIDISKRLDFIDSLFNNFIVNGMVELKLENSLEQTRQAQKEMYQHLQALEAKREAAGLELQKLQQKRLLLIKHA